MAYALAMQYMHIFRPIAVLSLVMLALPAMADVGSPKSAGVTRGKASIEYKGSRTGDDDAAQNNNQGHEFELYYGLTDRVKLGLERKYTRGAANSLEPDGLIPNVTFEATTQGDHWLSSAVFLEYAFKHSGSDAIKTVLIAERTQGPMTLRANLELAREVGGGRAHGIGYGGALQGIYRTSALISPGIEWHSDLGTLNDTAGWDDQKHYVGPIVTGTLFTVAEGSVGYAAGYYRGLTDASADSAQRVMLKYELSF